MSSHRITSGAVPPDPEAPLAPRRVGVLASGKVCLQKRSATGRKAQHSYETSRNCPAYPRLMLDEDGEMTIGWEIIEGLLPGRVCRCVASADGPASSAVRAAKCLQHRRLLPWHLLPPIHGVARHVGRLIAQFPAITPCRVKHAAAIRSAVSRVTLFRLSDPANPSPPPMYKASLANHARGDSRRHWQASRRARSAI